MGVKWMKSCNSNNAAGAVYGLGFVGALIYFLEHATTLAMALLGILKALVWPGILIYKVLGFLKM